MDELTLKSRMQGIPLLPSLTHDTINMLRYVTAVQRDFQQRLNPRSFLQGGPLVNKAMINEFKQAVEAFRTNLAHIFIK